MRHPIILCVVLIVFVVRIAGQFPFLDVSKEDDKIIGTCLSNVTVNFTNPILWPVSHGDSEADYFLIQFSIESEKLEGIEAITCIDVEGKSSTKSLDSTNNNPHDVSQPEFLDYKNVFYVVDNPFNLTCEVHEDDVNLLWEFPGKHLYTSSDLPIVQKKGENSVISTLVIKRAKSSDSGTYKCYVENHATKSISKEIEVKGSVAHFVNITRDSETSIFSPRQGEHFIWRATVRGFPTNITAVVSLPERSTQTPIKKKIDETGDLMVHLRNLSILDFGRYIVKACNEFSCSEETFFTLNITGKPEFYQTPRQHKINHREGSIRVNVLSHTAANITSQFYFSCARGNLSKLRECANKTKLEIHQVFPKKNSNMALFEYSHSQISSSGFLKLEVSNIIGSDSSTLQILLDDEQEQSYFTLLTLDRGSRSKTLKNGTLRTIVEGDSISVECGAHSFLYEDVHLSSSLHAEIPHTHTTKFEYKIDQMNITDISLNLSGTIYCTTTRWGGRSTVNLANISAIKKMPLVLDERTSNVSLGEVKEITVEDGQTFKLVCNVSSTPEPLISWKKDGKDTSHLEKNLANKTLTIKKARKEDGGRYECVAKSRAERQSYAVQMVIKAQELNEGQIGLIVFVVTLVIFLLGLVLYQKQKYKKKTQLHKELRRNQIYLFAKGNVGEINPESTMDEQAYLLPYDDSYEIEASRIKLGKCLGAGNFGRVVYGEVDGLNGDGSTTKAGIKMCKDNSDAGQLKALTLELKIMLHIGRHLNIVNLIGAYTTKMERGELWILVEYCQYGQLLQFILRHKSKFVSQVDPDTGLFDPSMAIPAITSPSIVVTNPNYSKFRLFSRSSTSQMLISSRPNGTNPSEKQSNSLCETGTCRDDVILKRTQSAAKTPILNNEYELEEKRRPSITSQLLADGHRVDSRPPTWPVSSEAVIQDSDGNYVIDCVPGVTEPFTTVTCILWAWQVANGMEYLVRRKVLHSDLAARNLLLAQQNVVKISDFGLSRDLYQKDVYIKKEGEVLPIKWMSLEAIQRRQFSTQSDIWAYGVTLWEIFTLGKTPYPGMPINEDFVTQLENGMRLPKPTNAPQEIYDVMLRCWEEDPEARPSFSDLSTLLAAMLDQQTIEKFTEMNSVHSDHNNDYFDRRTDYIQMMSTPELAHLESRPEFVCNYEDFILKGFESAQDPGYLPMSPKFYIPVNQKSADEASNQTKFEFFHGLGSPEPTEEQDAETFPETPKGQLDPKGQKFQTQVMSEDLETRNYQNIDTVKTPKKEYSYPKTCPDFRDENNSTQDDQTESGTVVYSNLSTLKDSICQNMSLNGPGFEECFPKDSQYVNSKI